MTTNLLGFLKIPSIHAQKAIKLQKDAQFCLSTWQYPSLLNDLFYNLYLCLK